MSPSPRAYGIDLGTTTSTIARVIRGVPTMLDGPGGVLVPSVVYVPPDGPLVVGEEAVRREGAEPERVLRSTKRDMGTDTVYAVAGRTLTPVDVAAAILRHLADRAEAATGERPRRVVITVPAWFTNAARSDTRRAGATAGLEVVRLVNEPTAAALAHPRPQADTPCTALVYDLGGGTFDVSLVRLDGEITEVLASHGDTRLGGDDVDEGVVAFTLAHVAEQDPALAAALQEDPAARRRLRNAAEAAKRAASAGEAGVVAVPFALTLDGRPRSVEVTLAREDLEDIVVPLFQRTLTSVDQILSDASITPEAIDDLLLVGGSTHLPVIWEGLKRRYGLEGSHAVPPQLAVGLGAAVQAAITDGDRVHGVIVDVAPFPLSIGMAAGGLPGFPTHFVCSVITPRNAPLPSRHTHLVRTSHPEQARIKLPVFQGSDPDPRRNTILGEIVMEDLPHAPADQMFRPIAVTFVHDLDGRVTITLRDQLSGQTAQGTVVADGHEQAALRASWEAWADEHDLTLGEPYGAASGARGAASGARSGADPGASAGETAPDAAAVHEARALLRQLLDTSILDVAPDCDPDLARRLHDDARAALLALGAGEVTRGLQLAEAIQDTMFEEGIYL